MIPWQRIWERDSTFSRARCAMGIVRNPAHNVLDFGGRTWLCFARSHVRPSEPPPSSRCPSKRPSTCLGASAPVINVFRDARRSSSACIISTGSFFACARDESSVLRDGTDGRNCCSRGVADVGAADSNTNNFALEIRWRLSDFPLPPYPGGGPISFATLDLF